MKLEAIFNSRRYPSSRVLSLMSERIRVGLGANPSRNPKYSEANPFDVYTCGIRVRIGFDLAAISQSSAINTAALNALGLAII
jgi:hypothetical protein